MFFPRALSSYEKILQEQYSISGVIKHKGERGRAREQEVRRFLKDHLPEAYGVATGEIIPAIDSEPSPQTDIIIYDRLRIPILNKNGEVQQVPIEGVYSAIEVKSLIDTSSLRDMASKIESTRKLKRHNDPPVQWYGPPLYVLLGYDLKTTPEQCLRFLRQNAENKAVIIAALGYGISIWLTDREDPVWITGRNDEDDLNETLTFLFVSLVGYLHDMDLGDFDFIRMLLS